VNNDLKNAKNAKLQNGNEILILNDFWCTDNIQYLLHPSWFCN
jgi:hypothetical protein